MVSDRIEALIAHFCNGNKSLFAQKIGVTPSVIGNITGERKGNPSFEVIQKILDAFASVSPDWFILEKGSMLREDITQQYSDSVSMSSDVVTLRLMDRLEEKDTKIDQLQSELLVTKEELATIKVKLSQYECPNPPKRRTVRQLEAGNLDGKDHAENASTKKHSSPNADDAISANVP